MSTTQTTPHRWRFFSAGGFDQARLDRGSDLINLKHLDQKLWVALSCPSAGLEFDTATLALIDSDGDGHIRAPELIAAIDWAAERLTTPDTLIGDKPLPLSAIADNEAGRAILAAAKQVLASLGKPEAEEIAVSDTAGSVAAFHAQAYNGDGIITAKALDETQQAALSDIIATLGSQTDRSGEPGIDQATLDRFFSEAQALQAWRSQPETDAGTQPLGPDTAAAWSTVLAVKDKIDDFFTRCQLAAFDPRAGDLLNSAEDELRALGKSQLTVSNGDIASLPLAWVKNGAELPLTAGVNPAWQTAIATLRQQAIIPLLGEREQLSQADWQDIQARLAPYANWLNAKPATPLEQLAPERLSELLNSDIQTALNEHLARDLALANEAGSLSDLDRLVRYVRDLDQLANNFVSFRDFYTRRDKAVFQAGTLYIDGRSCDLCLKVLDATRHATLATLSGTYLVYCDCRRGAEKMTIAAAVTAGDADQLMVGRNGVFYDREGRDWDATVTKIIDHPISIRQAFWAPYKKVVRLVAEQAQKFAAARAKASDEMLTNQVTKAGQKVEEGKPAAPANAFDVGKFAGIFAAVGLAVGAIGTALVSLVTGFMGLKAWQMPLVLVGLMLLISGPAMAMAFFKLRNRNLGPILDANGWAVNTRARINIPFGTALTQTAKLPDDAERALGDPYAEAATPWKLYFGVGIVAMVLLYFISR